MSADDDASDSHFESRRLLPSFSPDALDLAKLAAPLSIQSSRKQNQQQPLAWQKPCLMPLKIAFIDQYTGTTTRLNTGD